MKQFGKGWSTESRARGARAAPAGHASYWGEAQKVWHIPAVSSGSRTLSARLSALVLAAALVACQPPADPLRTTGPATLSEAQQYVLALVNRDREQAGLRPVQWDETAARAAQRHAEDMAGNGFTGHWGTDGSVPEQRYTEAGGTRFAQENSACFFDGVARQLDASAVFDRTELEKVEAAFINEVPPSDGHRRNILTPQHNRLGVGLAKPAGLTQPCLAQEFVDDYGEFAPLPTEARVGDTIRVEGEVLAPVEFGGVGIGRVDAAAPIAVAELLGRSTYAIPEPYVLFFPAGFKTPKPVEVDGNHFGIDVKLDDAGRPGRYQVSVWGRYPDSDALVMVSLRTIIVK